MVRDTVELPQLQQLLADEGYLLDQIYVEVVDYAWNTYSTEVQLSGSHFTTEDNSDDTVTITRYSGVSTSLEIPSEIDGQDRHRHRRGRLCRRSPQQRHHS